MKEDRDDGRNFEERLLRELKAVVARRDAEQAAAIRDAQPPVRRRAPRLALAAAGAIAAAALLLFNSGGDNAQRAFAVEPQESGGVTIKVYSLEDAAGLEEALEDAGIQAQVTWLEPGTSCREPHFTPSRVQTPMGGAIGGMTMTGPGAVTISVMSSRQYRERRREYMRGEISTEDYHRSIGNISLDPDRFRPDQTVVISGSPRPFDGDPEGGYEARFGIAAGPVKPCEPVTTPASNVGAIKLPRGAGAPRPASARPPASGQFLYTKTKLVQLQGWDPDGPGAGPRDKPRYFTANLLGPEGDALPALVTTLKEVWMNPAGRTRVRETLDRVEFLSAEDQERWQEAGSPPPFEYDPAEHAVGRDRSGRPVKQFRSRYWRGRNAFANVAKISRLPVEPEALRLAVENRRGGNPDPVPPPAASQIGSATAARLIELLGEPIVTPAVQAAAFYALAEIPGIELRHGVADALGRRGDAVIWVRERGFGLRLIFDPRTSRLLANAEVIFDAESARYPGVPDGTAFRETAYLRSRIVD